MPKQTTPPMRQSTKPQIRCLRDNQLESSSDEENQCVEEEEEDDDDDDDDKSFGNEGVEERENF